MSDFNIKNNSHSLPDTHDPIIETEQQTGSPACLTEMDSAPRQDDTEIMESVDLPQESADGTIGSDISSAESAAPQSSVLETAFMLDNNWVMVFRSGAKVETENCFRFYRSFLEFIDALEDSNSDYGKIALPIFYRLLKKHKGARIFRSERSFLNLDPEEFKEGFIDLLNLIRGVTVAHAKILAVLEPIAIFDCQLVNLNKLQRRSFGSKDVI